MPTRHAACVVLCLLLFVVLIQPATAFSWVNVTTQGSCEKAWPCGFTAHYTGAASSDYNRPVNIYILENGYPIEQVYRYTGEQPYYYTLPPAQDGIVQGFFTPGHFMQTQRSYGLLVQYGNSTANTTFQLNTYRQPDIMGDVLIWLNSSVFYFIIFLIVGLILLLLLSWIWRR